MGPTLSHRVRRRLLILTLLAIVGAGLAAAPAALADLITPESGGSPNANGIDTLYKIVLAIAVVVFIGVEGALIYSLVRFRARKGAVAAQIHGNTRLELGWTIGAAAILVVLATITFVKLGDLTDPPASDPGGLAQAAGAQFASTSQPKPPPGTKYLTVDVNGQQFLWRYTYANGAFAYDEMVVPEKTTVVLNIRAQDVAHSWWIPKLGGKFDAVPGYTNKTWFKAPRAGVTYTGQCAELCGRGHANTLARAKVVTVPEFAAWLGDQKRSIDEGNKLAAQERQRQLDAAQRAQPAAGAAPAAGAPAASAAAGKQVFVAQGCGACHTLADAGSNGKIGPALDQAIKSDSAATILKAIVNPNAEIAKGFAKGVMPATYGQTLTKDQLKTLVDYLVKATH